MSKKKDLSILVAENLSISDGPLGESVVISIQPEGKESLVVAYPPDTPAAEIASDSTSLSGISLAPDQMEVLTEEVERSKWLGAGYEFGIKIAGIVDFQVKKQAHKEKKITKRMILKPQK